MERLGLLSLPPEILHHISSFLSVQDVLSCSATCHYLRHTFNDDTVWKKFLPKQFISCLQDQEHCVKLSSTPYQTLTPLCSSRVNYIKKANVVKNWRRGNFKKYSMKITCTYANGTLNVPRGKGNVIYKDNYLFLSRFINYVESDAIEVWNIYKEPVLLLELKMNELYYKCFYIVGDCLVVVECIQVKVYRINITEKTFLLLYSFLITENYVSFHDPVNHIGRHDVRCDGWHYSMVGDHLFSSKCENEPNSCFFHIWDITNASKVGSYTPPIVGVAMDYCTHVENNWFLRMIKQSGDSFFFQFNIETGQFSDCVLKVNKHALNYIIYNSHVILFDRNYTGSAGRIELIGSVYNFNTSDLLRERRFTSDKNISVSTNTINGQFVVLCPDYFEVVDTLTLKTLARFSCEDSFIITNQFNVYGSVFIFAVNSRNVYEIWDISEQKKIDKGLHEVYTSHLYLNESCSKVACVGRCKISILHFL